MSEPVVLESAFRPEASATIPSPFPHNEDLLNKNCEESYFDIVVPTQEGAPPLHFHRMVLCKASTTLKNVFCEKNQHPFFRVTVMSDGQTVLTIPNGVEKTCVLDLFHFFYGEVLKVFGRTVVPMLAMFLRLKVKDFPQVQQTLEDLIFKRGKRYIDCGMQMLQQCMEYEECHNNQMTQIDQKLATMVLTHEKIYLIPGIAFDDCLRRLTVRHFSSAQRGLAKIGFNVRMHFVSVNKDRLSKEEKREVIRGCDLQHLSANELNQLRELDIFDKDELLDLFMDVIKHGREQSESEENSLHFLFSLLQRKTAHIQKSSCGKQTIFRKHETYIERRVWWETKSDTKCFDEIV